MDCGFDVLMKMIEYVTFSKREDEEGRKQRRYRPAPNCVRHHYEV
jgi:hypothetical protein